MPRAEPSFKTDSLRYAQEVVLKDPRFEVIDAVDYTTVLRRSQYGPFQGRVLINRLRNPAEQNACHGIHSPPARSAAMNSPNSM
jgi:hypothetical protein